jgi:poly(3-hydroxybutyrate) depolymerase
MKQLEKIMKKPTLVAFVLMFAAITIPLRLDAITKTSPVASELKQKTTTAYSGKMTLNVDGVTRSTLIYVPANLDSNRPLLLSLHGRWGSGNDMKNTARFETIADTAKFIVAYPDGLPQPVLGGNTGWDAGGETDNDIALFRAIRDTLSILYNIDKNRVYLTGFSLGGMETYHASNVAADDFAAFASCSGYPLNEYHRYYTGARPVPFLHIHGKADDFVKYDSVAIVVDNMVARGGCNPIPAVTTKSGVYTCSDYAAGNGGFEYLYYALDGVGHEYRVSDAFNTSLVMWNFVKRFKLDDVCDRTMKWNPNLPIQSVGSIPDGWMANVDGIVIKAQTGAASGPRIIQLADGSDFTRGFYFCSTQTKGYLFYGSDVQRPLQLTTGIYKVSFKTIGVKLSDKNQKIFFQILNRKTNKEVLHDSIAISSCLDANTALNSSINSYTFATSAYGEYVLRWSVTGVNTEAVMSDVSLHSTDHVIDNVNSVSAAGMIKDKKRYDLGGCRVSSTIPGHVYIVNGKKKIAN